MFLLAILFHGVKEVHTKSQILPPVAYAHFLWLNFRFTGTSRNCSISSLDTEKCFGTAVATCSILKLASCQESAFSPTPIQAAQFTLLHTGHLPGIRLVEALTIWLSTEHNSTSGKIVEMLSCSKSLWKAFAIISPHFQKGAAVLMPFKESLRQVTLYNDTTLNWYFFFFLSNSM